jgi:hypothetical protein
MLVGPSRESAEVHNQSISQWLNIELNQDDPAGFQLSEEAVTPRSSTPVATISETATADDLDLHESGTVTQPHFILKHRILCQSYYLQLYQIFSSHQLSTQLKVILSPSQSSMKPGSAHGQVHQLHLSRRESRVSIWAKMVTMFQRMLSHSIRRKMQTPTPLQLTREKSRDLLPSSYSKVLPIPQPKPKKKKQG